MEILPAIDLLEGRAVRLHQGRREEVTVVGDPLDLAHRFAAEGATRLHVVDLDGAFAGRPMQLALVRKLADVLPLELGGGLRTEDDLRAALDAGAERLVLGTAAVEKPLLLNALHPDQLVVGVDVKDGRVATHGWLETVAETPRAFARAMVQAGVRRLLCTAVWRDGTLEGPDFQLLSEVASAGLPVIASGGVGSEADLVRLAKEPGIEAVVVGKAIYAGRVDLRRAIAIGRGEAC